MALPELKPQLNQESNPAEPLKVTWLEGMLKKKAESDENKPAPTILTANASMEPVLNTVSDNLNKTLDKLGANDPQLTKTGVLEPKEVVPKAPDYSKAIGWGIEGKSLSSSPISGSILKLLMEAPGDWKSKIEKGMATGHTYNLLHQPGQRNFFLFDKWTQADGTPKKVISTFEIKNPDDVKPETGPTEDVSNETSDNAAIDSKIMATVTPFEVGHVEVPDGAALEPVKPMEEILKPPVQEQAFVKIPMIPDNDDTQNPDKLPKVKNEIPLAQAPNSHFRLMRARFAKQEFNQKHPTEQAKVAYQQKVDQNDQPGFVTKIREYEAEQEAAKPTFLEWAFGTKPEGRTLEQWNVMKNVPTDAFMNPEKYSWEGMPQDLAFENYPDEFKSLRNKVMNAVEELSHKGEDLKTLPLEKALEKIVDLDLV